MPKLGSITPRKIIALLKRKGFVFDHATGSHHFFYHPATQRRTTVAYHNRPLPKGTAHAILKAAGLSIKDL